MEDEDKRQEELDRLDAAQEEWKLRAMGTTIYSFLPFYIFPGNRKTPETLRFRGILRLDTTLSCDNKSIFRLYYSMIEATRPDPTVRPPSRIAKVRPCSIAIGWISSMVISTLSPGMHISVPAGSSQTPVTSVVLK